MQQVIGPVYDRHVANGKLVSWGWMEHIIGGEYRRIATMTAADLDSLLAARAAILDDLVDHHMEALTEFSAICDSHQDVLWEIVFESP